MCVIRGRALALAPAPGGTAAAQRTSRRTYVCNSGSRIYVYNDIHTYMSMHLLNIFISTHDYMSFVLSIKLVYSYPVIQNVYVSLSICMYISISLCWYVSKSINVYVYVYIQL